jgi:hypothetical protein
MKSVESQGVIDDIKIVLKKNYNPSIPEIGFPQLIH